MIWRRISLIIAKYVAIFLCLMTILLTTPWGSHFTLALVDNIDGFTVDYHRGALIRDLELKTFRLQREKLEIEITGLSVAIDFACLWKKTLCIKSASADEFILHYIDNKDVTRQQFSDKTFENQLFEMPFIIEADKVTLQKSRLVINNTEISVEQFVARVVINKSEFTLAQPSAKQLTVKLNNKEALTPITMQSTSTSINSIFAQLPVVDLPISLVIQQLHVDDISVEKKGSQQWLSSNNQLSGSWENTEVNISQFKTSTSTFAINEFTAKLKLTPPYQLNTQFISHFKELPWWPEIANSSQQIALNGSFEDLAINIISKGNLAMVSQGRVDLLQKDLPFKLTLEATKIPMPLSYAHYAEPSSLALAVSGTLAKQTITLTSQINSYGYDNAKINIAAEHQQGHFSISELLFNEHDSASQLHIHGDLTLQPENISWQLAAKSSGFSLPKIKLKTLTELGQNQEHIDAIAAHLPESITGRLQGNVSSTGTWSENSWSVSVDNSDLSGLVNSSPFKVKGDIGLNKKGHLQAGELLVALNNNKLTLQTNSGSFWDINGQLSVAELSDWSQDIRGSLISNFSVKGEQDNPFITLNSQFTELNWQHWHSNSLKISTNYQPMNDHQIQLNMNNDTLTFEKDNKGLVINDFIFSVSGNINNHQINANWLGDITGQLALNGHSNNNFTHWQGSVEPSKLTYQHIEMQNNKTVSLSADLSKQQLTIENHCWQATGLALCLPNKAIIGSAGDVTVKVAVDLSVIDALFLSEEVELISKINGEIKANWSKQQTVNASAHFALSPGYLNVIDDFNEHQLSQWQRGELTFTVDEHLLTSSMQLTDTQDNNFVNINSTITLINDYPIDTKIVLNKFNFQPFQAVLGSVVNLQGNLSADVSIDGTLDSPLLSGNIRLDSGKLLLRQNANTFDKISSTFTIENNQATLLGTFFVEDKEANLTGQVSWQDGLALNLDLQADTLPLVFPPQLVMNIVPSLNFSLLEKTLTISGNIDVLDGSYNIEKLAEGSVSLSDDVIIVDQYGKAEVKQTTGFNLKTDVRVNIAKAFKISGQGLDSHLFGQLQINQKEKQPLQLFGRIQSEQGTFQAYGQKLQIEKGELTFNGPIKNPYFNLRASRHIKAEDIDVGINITGLADALDMQLFSSPTMEMPEMLSYLVRGRSIDAGTSNSTAAASLLVGFGVTNSVGLFDRLEKIPLINNIAVDTEGEGDKTQATVSGYLGEQVYLKYGIGVYEPINELTVRMYLFNRFWLEIVSGIEQSTDIYYSFDID